MVGGRQRGDPCLAHVACLGPAVLLPVLPSLLWALPSGSGQTAFSWELQAGFWDSSVTPGSLVLLPSLPCHSRCRLPRGSHIPSASGSPARAHDLAHGRAPLPVRQWGLLASVLRGLQCNCQHNWPVARVAECPEPSTPHVGSFLLFNNARLSLISYKPSSRSAERIGTMLTRLKRKNRPSVSRPHCSGGGSRVWQGLLSAGPRQMAGTRGLLEQERQSGGSRKRTPPWGVGLA